MAGRHVGQVLQQPQRLNPRQTLFGPAGKVEVAFLIEAFLDSGRKLTRQREDVVRSVNHADAIRIMFAMGKAAIGQRELRGRHAHLDFAAHDLEALLDAAGHRLLKRAKLFDLPGEVASLSGDRRGQLLVGQRFKNVDAALALDQRIPDGGASTANWADQAETGDNDAYRRIRHAAKAFVNRTKCIRGI